MKMNPKREIDRSTKKLFEAIVSLGNLRVPCVAAVYDRGDIIQFGTKSCQQKFESMLQCSCPCSCQQNSSWNETFRNEQIELSDSSTDTFDQKVIEARGILTFIKNSRAIPKLPANLSLMNFKELINATKIVLQRDHFEQGKTGSDIKYGREDWTPSSSIWDLEKVPWSEVTSNFKDLKSFPRGQPMLPFLREVIRKYYTSKGYDPESYVLASFSNADKKRRLNKRGYGDGEQKSIKSDFLKVNKYVDQEQGNENCKDEYVDDVKPHVTSMNSEALKWIKIDKNVKDKYDVDGKKRKKSEDESPSKIFLMASMDSSEMKEKKILEKADIFSDEIVNLNATEVNNLENTNDCGSDIDELSENVFINENNIENHTEKSFPQIMKAQSSDTFSNEKDLKDATKIRDNEENSDSKSYDIIKFLTDISLSELIDLFVSEAVTMEMLYQMDGNNLKELGVTKYGHRFHILGAIKRMFV